MAYEPVEASEAAIEDAARLLNEAMQEKLLPPIHVPKGPSPIDEFARVLLEVAARCGSVRGNINAEAPQEMVFTLAGVRMMRYPLAYAQGLFRSVLARLANIVNGTLHASVPAAETVDRPDMTGLSIEEEKRRLVAFVTAVVESSAVRDAEIALRGLPSANPYGFQAVIPYRPYGTPDQQAIRLSIETNNRNLWEKPFYFDITVVPSTESTELPTSP